MVKKPNKTKKPIWIQLLVFSWTLPESLLTVSTISKFFNILTKNMSISLVISRMVARKAPQGVSLFSRRGESICVKGFFFRVEFWICLKDFFIKWMISHSRRNIQLFALFHSCPCTCRSRLPKTKEFSAKNLSFLKISSLFLGNLYFFIYFCRKKSYSGFKNST